MPSTAVDIADTLLCAAARRRSAITIEPAGRTHAISLEEASGARTVASLPGELADAVVARLAILAGLDVMAPEQLGRIRVRAGADAHDLLVSIYASIDGLAAELRCIVPVAQAARNTGEHEIDDSSPLAAIGPYRIDAELGVGGTGVVYRAEHTALGKPVAIKLLHADVARDKTTAARFVREARAASRARHPGIVDVTDFGTLADGRAYLVMELIEAPTLEDLLQSHGAFEPGLAVKVAREIALALDAAHRAGVVHRDLKPANVFLVNREPTQVKIADFGAAKLVDSAAEPRVSQAGQIFGTPYYMSPEHARGHDTDRRTDVYALGCVLFELLTGTVPFEGEEAVDVLSKQITVPPPRPTSPVGPLPEAVFEVIETAMAKRADERYPTAADMAADLDRAWAALARAGWRRWLPL